MKSPKELHNRCLELLSERGVELEQIAELVYFLQEKYVPGLTKEECLSNVHSVLKKREVQNAVITGIEMDKLAEEKKLHPLLNDVLSEDEPLYGVDEILALSIVNVYGSIGFTNYGYIDKVKPGILKNLDDKSTGKVNIFLDDLVGAIAAAAASRLAHSIPAKEELD